MGFFRNRLRFVTLLVHSSILLPLTSAAPAQTAKPPAPAPDVLIFTNGDQLTGTLLHGAGSSIVFKSDMAGEITVPLDKIKELRSHGSFAILRKDTPIKSIATAQQVAVQGTVSVADGNLTVDRPAAAPQPVPTAQIGRAHV